MEGWYDPVPTGGTAANTAGIVSYQVLIYEVLTGGDILPLPTTLIESTTQDVPFTSLTFPADKAPNAYDIHFAVKDHAENVQECRAVVFHDSTSQLLTNENFQMNAETGTAETDYVWQINNGPVVWRWDGFFYNDWIINHNVLKPMTQSNDRWGGLYSQLDGWVPVIGTHNIDGIIITNSYQADDEDYEPTKPEYHNDTRAIFDAEKWEVVPSCSDGDKYIMWKWVFDYREQELIEFCNIYIDSTPPNVEMLGAFYNDEREIEGISHDKFYPDMQFLFDVWDPHSNIYDILWTFGTTEDGSEVGEGAEPVIKYAKDVSMAQLRQKDCPGHVIYDHSTKKPVTTMLTYPWKCTVLHCNHLGNTWKPLVLMT